MFFFLFLQSKSSFKNSGFFSTIALIAKFRPDPTPRAKQADNQICVRPSPGARIVFGEAAAFIAPFLYLEFLALQ